MPDSQAREELMSHPTAQTAGVYALLADGTTVQIRPAGAGDFDAVGGGERQRKRVEHCFQRGVDLRSGDGRLRHGPTVRIG